MDLVGVIRYNKDSPNGAEGNSHKILGVVEVEKYGQKNINIFPYFC
ncbi:MAG: hypothetical protein ACI85I_002824 [Arenicella sp.]|jgi:hypothetical protein